MNITLPSVATITQTIAALPELARGTVNYWAIAYPVLMARLNGGSNPLLDFLEDEDEDDHAAPLEPWKAVRLGLEFLMLVRSHNEFDQDFHTVLDQAAPEIDNPQIAMDVIMAMAQMLNVVIDDEAIARFSAMVMEAEVSTS